MSGRQVLITYFAGALVVELILIGLMKHLGADSESIGSAYALFLGGAALGGGYFFTRYY